MTGLAAGLVSGQPVFEKQSYAGGICSSYYVRPHTTERLHSAPADGDAYRFEIGGGHWLFGGDPLVLQFIRRTTAVRRYERRSSVFFSRNDRMVSYPIQNHLAALGSDVANRALAEMRDGDRRNGPDGTMAEQHLRVFGSTLYGMFFRPFNERYSAGLYSRISPQDQHKSPVDLALAARGASGSTKAVGYNTTYLYPVDGLDALARGIANRVDVRYGLEAVRIDLDARVVHFDEGSEVPFDRLISTLPLNTMLRLTNASLPCEDDPYTSVLVLNIGAVKGRRCPDDHWLYVPDAESEFHRVGFYSAVDSSFLPTRSRERGGRVGIYVEKAFVGWEPRPSAEACRAYSEAVVREFQAWGFIEDVEVVDPTWIDVAYTWTWPGSTWRKDALTWLDDHGVSQVGRYGRWVFQGIADSIRDGFIAGGSALVQP